jgi:hypothetical protein
VVVFVTEYEQAAMQAARYEVDLQTVDRESALAAAE